MSIGMRYDNIYNIGLSRLLDANPLVTSAPEAEKVTAGFLLFWWTWLEGCNP